LYQSGFDVVIIDDLSNSDGSALKGIQSIIGQEISFYQVDAGDELAVNKVFELEGKVDGIIHFAAYKAVNESVEQP
jgi:UDP-glucose 4-epimerase